MTVWTHPGGLIQGCCGQVHLQEFSWTEDNKPAAIAQRVEHAQHAEERAQLTTAPMFCFQTAMALHRWSCLTYMGTPCSFHCVKGHPWPVKLVCRLPCFTSFE